MTHVPSSVNRNARRRIGWGADILLTISLGFLQTVVLGWFWFGAGMEGWADSYDDRHGERGPLWDQAVTATVTCAVLALLAAVAVAWWRRAWITALTQVSLAVLLLGMAVTVQR